MCGRMFEFVAPASAGSSAQVPAVGCGMHPEQGTTTSQMLHLRGVPTGPLLDQELTNQDLRASPASSPVL